MPIPRAAGADEVNNRSIVSALAAVERNALQGRQARLAGAGELRPSIHTPGHRDPNQASQSLARVPYRRIDALGLSQGRAERWQRVSGEPLTIVGSKHSNGERPPGDLAALLYAPSAGMYRGSPSHPG